MSSRIAGAVLALIAAGSIALSLLVFSWWSGHPTVGGKTFERKEVYISLLSATGHDERGDQPLELGTGFATTRYIELGTGGVLVVSAVLLALFAMFGSEKRQGLAKVVISAAGASIIVALALLLLGPDIVAGQQKITVPKDLIGMLTFWVGTALAIVAGVLAMRPTPRVVLRPPRVVSAAPVAHSAQTPVSQPPVDVLSFLDEPVAPPPPAPSANTPLPGPSGPLGAQFNSGPQLRPLYDAAPSQGGSGGFVPGMATPPELTARGMPPPSPPPPPKPLPPPIRNRPPSAAPPTSRGLPSPTRPPPINRPQSTFAAAVVPPPPPPQTMLPQMRQETDPGDDHLETVERDKHVADSLDSTFDAAATAALADVPIDGSGTEQTEIGGNLAIGDSTNVSSIQFETSGPTSESARYEENPDDELLATMARERIGATDRDLPTVSEPVSAAHSIAAAVLAPSASGNSSRIAISQPAPVSVRTPAAPPAPAITVPKIFPVKTPPPPRTQTPPPTPKLPISTAPDSLPPPSEKQVKNSGPSPACPQCESPMAWVEAHLRFYCKSCRMYF
ncbi:MAG TPA: hypothetical protein VIU61_06270 [Kofleriaceae bacterium]